MPKPKTPPTETPRLPRAGDLKHRLSRNVVQAEPPAPAGQQAGREARIDLALQRLNRAIFGGNPAAATREELKEAIARFSRQVDELPEERLSSRNMIAKWKTRPLPSRAPELWSERDLNLRERVPEFIRRVYGPWLDGSLERRTIAALDPPLYKALSVWLTRNPDDPISGILPAKGLTTRELLDRLQEDYSEEEIRKLGYAIGSRLRRTSQT